jgi:hypothetical protein
MAVDTAIRWQFLIVAVAGVVSYYHALAGTYHRVLTHGANVNTAGMLYVPALRAQVAE